jgi:hypothetical protein
MNGSQGIAFVLSIIIPAFLALSFGVVRGFLRRRAARRQQRGRVKCR